MPLQKSFRSIILFLVQYRLLNHVHAFDLFILDSYPHPPFHNQQTASGCDELTLMLQIYHR